MATETRELETKFSVHGLFALPDLVDPDAGITRVERRPALTLRATYVDTPGLRLAREGITLRHRTGEGSQRWTLKLPRTGASPAGLARDEISVHGDATLVPEELHRLLFGVLRGDPISPAAVLSTHRVTLALLADDGDELGEVVDDTVSLLDGRRVLSRFREIEIEEGPGDGAAAACLAAGRRLLAAGAISGEQLPKLVRALGPQAQQPSDLPAPPEVTRRAPASELVLWSLRTGLARVVTSDIGVRRHEHDAVHQMRVACRRLRSDLRTFAALLDEPRAELLRDELVWFSGALAEARDLEVLLVRVVRTAAADQHFPVDPVALEAILGLLREKEVAALAVAHDAVNSDRYLGLLRLLVELAEDPQWAPLARERCRDVLPGLVGATWRHLAKRAERLRPDDPDEAWHRARILAKRARYATELAAVALGKDAKAAAKAATAVQEHLGGHQDAAVAAERLLALPLLRPGDTALATTCGRLAERERSVALELRRSFPGRWRGVRRGRATRWLGE